MHPTVDPEFQPDAKRDSDVFSRTSISSLKFTILLKKT